MLTFDFESQAIAPRPDYPPAPVGVALTTSRLTPRYVGWGHPAGNNAANSRKAVQYLRTNWDRGVLCHNASFDIAIAHERLNLPLPDDIHDTMFLAFLLDPYGDLSLKPLAERYLGVPPTERDAVRDWLVDQKVVRKSAKNWGAHIAAAPGDLVGTYAVGDVTRTLDLYRALHPKVRAAGMLPAYDRERALVPMLLDNSARGIPVARARLLRDLGAYEEVLLHVERQLKESWREELGTTPPDAFAGGDFAQALLDAGCDLPRTRTGKVSTAKDSLSDALPDGRVKGLLLYRSALEKSLSTYMRPWAAQATGGHLHCSWNQVRTYDETGARTGRLSSSPNFQNITNPEKYAEMLALIARYGCKWKWLSLPNLRSYIEAPKGWQLFTRDYSQQELRMLAHYEDDVLAAAYREDPKLDLHQFVSGMIRGRTGLNVSRKQTKTINFAKIYGAGAAKIAAQMGVSLDEARAVLNAYERALPSIKIMQDDLKSIGRSGEYITTLGGRRYHAEPAKIVHGELRTFEYKLLNYLIQGSSADQTKEAMRLWWTEHLRARDDVRFVVSVHDELIGMAPTKLVKQKAAELDRCMVEAFALDVPVATDLRVGKNLGNMR
jgi:DNA polymerase-1